jgi:hypothetical protein
MKNENWQTYLNQLSFGLNGINLMEPNCETVLERANFGMQQKYPGRYVVEAFFDPNTLKWNLRLKFFDPKDHTMFLLRYS